MSAVNARTAAGVIVVRSAAEILSTGGTTASRAYGYRAGTSNTDRLRRKKPEQMNRSIVPLQKSKFGENRRNLLPKDARSQ
jgi:hypothetical protein